MTWELKILAWTLVLAFVQIILFDMARTGQYGLKWNTGARDEADLPPLSAKAGRLKRIPFEDRPTMQKLAEPIMQAYAKEIDASGIQTAIAGA